MMYSIKGIEDDETEGFVHNRRFTNVKIRHAEECKKYRNNAKGKVTNHTY